MYPASLISEKEGGLLQEGASRSSLKLPAGEAAAAVVAVVEGAAAVVAGGGLPSL